ncbi:ribosomal maturation YjgA family protein [Bacteroides sp.]
MRYKRWINLAITFIIILSGLASRKYSDTLPEFIAKYAGDTLWAAMVYFGIRFLFPSVSVLKTATISLLFSYCIEISQLYQADWANAIRSTTLGALIFGHGFLWSDMICYTVGVLVSAVVDYWKDYLHFHRRT